MITAQKNDNGKPTLWEDNIRVGSGAGVAEDYFAALQRREHLEPETALLLATLEDAIDCYKKYSSEQNKLGKERFREAEYWLMEEKDNRLFSFVSICEVLGLDPQYIRHGLREWKNWLSKTRKAVFPAARAGERHKLAWMHSC